MNFVCLALSLFLSVCFNEPLKPFRIKGFGQGSTYQILYYGYDSLVKKEQVEQLLNSIDESMSLYKEGSLINKFNASKRGELIDADFNKVVEKALQVYTESEGLFDITVKPLVDAWGFGVKKRTALPDSAKITDILNLVGSGNLKLVGDSLLKNRPEIEIDLNGIAQGYMVDKIAELLEENGIENYLVELGGEVRVKGQHANGAPFKVGIESPDAMNTEGLLHQSITMHKGAITTSGNYRRFVESGGTKYGHLINPLTGYPFQNTLIAVTVITSTALDSDAYDNVLMGLGLQESFKFLAKKKDLEAYFIYRKADGSIGDTATTGFYKNIIKH